MVSCPQLIRDYYKFMVVGDLHNRMTAVNTSKKKANEMIYEAASQTFKTECLQCLCC